MLTTPGMTRASMGAKGSSPAAGIGCTSAMAKQPKTARVRIDGIWAVLNDKRSVSDRLKMERRQTIGIDRYQSCSLPPACSISLSLGPPFRWSPMLPRRSI
jgi:hypothetical protein